MQRKSEEKKERHESISATLSHSHPSYHSYQRFNSKAIPVMTSTSASPPSYEEGSQVPLLANIKNGYVSVPMDEPSAMPSSHQHEGMAASLGLKTDGGIYTGMQGKVADVESIYKFIAAQGSVSPPLYLKVTGSVYVPHTWKNFEITIGLPISCSEQGTLFSKADDCPSFRLPAATRFSRPSSSWGSTYKENACVHSLNPVSKELEKASKASIQHWNDRRIRNLIPPWISLRQGLSKRGIRARFECI